MRRTIFGCMLLASAITLASCGSNNSEKNKESMNKEPRLKEENVVYSTPGDSVEMNGYVVYDELVEGPRPAIFVVHEWWGLTDYPKMRARELAKLGYIAMAVDIYGGGKLADNPGDAQKLATPFYQDPALAKTRFDAAVAKLKTYPQMDSSRTAGIGYCFGGGLLLNIARLGEDLDGVVSFHGTLLGTPAKKDLLKARILVCHGGADPMVPDSDVQQFKEQMDSIGANYQFETYPGATHAFTNPNATAMGEKFNIPIRYDAAADSASWNHMKSFLKELFGGR